MVGSRGIKVGRLEEHETHLEWEMTITQLADLALKYVRSWS